MKITLNITQEKAEQIAKALLLTPPAEDLRDPLTLICNQVAIATSGRSPMCSEILRQDYTQFRSRRAGHLPKSRVANHPQ